MSTPFTVVIPARFASTRLPGKPLVDIAGKPMIQHVYERALASGATEVIVATDDDRVRHAGEAFGARVEMTSSRHRCGTERTAEVASRLEQGPGWIVVNVQGDVPLIPPRVIAQVAANLADRSRIQMATLCERVQAMADVFDPAMVKVVFDRNGYALYFSRAPIPWYRDHFDGGTGTTPPGSRHFRHIGIYAYRVAYLQEYLAQSPCELERAESLEQLRALHGGARIHVAEAVERPGPGVDTVEDLERVRLLLSGA